MNLGIPDTGLIEGRIQRMTGRFGSIYSNEYLTEHTHHAEQILLIRFLLQG